MPDWVVLGFMVFFVAAAIIAIAWRLSPADAAASSEPVPERTGVPAVLVILVLVAIAAVAAWWFLVYDTAAGRCNRGDVGACIVWEAQQNQGR